MIKHIQKTMNEKEKEIRRLSLKVREHEDQLKELMKQRSMPNEEELQISLQINSTSVELAHLNMKLSKLEDELDLAVTRAKLLQGEASYNQKHTTALCRETKVYYIHNYRRYIHDSLWLLHVRPVAVWYLGSVRFLPEMVAIHVHVHDV